MKDPALFFGDLMKLMRSQWLTLEQIQLETKAGKATVRTWLAGLQAQGLVDCKVGEPTRGRQPPAPVVWAVTKAWGGVA